MLPGLLKYSSICGYLSALRHLKITLGHPDPCMNNVFLQCSIGNQPVHIRLPITPDMLFKLKQVWSSRYVHPDITMMWAACCLGFCISLLWRIHFNHSAPFQVDGVHVDDHRKPHMHASICFCVRVKQTHTAKASPC